VYVAPPKLALSDDLPLVRTRRKWSPTASTLIHGARDAVLVDALIAKDESRAFGRLGGDPGSPAMWVGELSIDARNTVVTCACSSVCAPRR
jgi:hypothetical protein